MSFAWVNALCWRLRRQRKSAEVFTRRPPASRARRRAPLALEALEDRLTPSLSAISNTTGFPYRAIVEVAVTFADGAHYVGSGSMVDRFHVLTAAHMLYSWADRGPTNNPFPVSITVTPGMNGSYDPYGTAQGVWVRVYDQWESWNQRYPGKTGAGAVDIGLITLNKAIGDLTGWLGMYYQTTTNVGQLNSFYGSEALNTAGYPGSNSNPVQLLDGEVARGTIMYHDFGRTSGVSSDGTLIEFSQYAIETHPGQSGSPVWYYNGSSDSSNGAMGVEVCQGGATRITQQMYNDFHNDMNYDATYRPPQSAYAASTSAPSGTYASFQLQEDTTTNTVPPAAPTTVTYNLPPTTQAPLPVSPPPPPSSPPPPPSSSSPPQLPLSPPTTYVPPSSLVHVPMTAGTYDWTTGNWYLRNANTLGPPSAGQFQFGGPGPAGGGYGIVGDWQGNGQFTPAIFYPGNSTWYVRASNAATSPLLVAPFQFGDADDIPLAGDWFGDGHMGIGVYDMSTSTFYLRDGTNGGRTLTVHYGEPGWDLSPVVGDFTGSGVWTIGLVQLSTMTWLLKTSNTPGAADLIFQWGSPGYLPIVGDWGGHGKAGIGLVAPITNQPSSPYNGQNFYYLRNEVNPGYPDAAFFPFGAAGWSPVVGQWSLPTNPLSNQLADGEGPGAAPITQAHLSATVGAALGRLQQAGVSPESLGRLASATYQLAALPAGQLGYTTASQALVQISADAAGHGWFVDPTPSEDEEFAGGQALAGSAAAGQEDLLTVVLHEMAHLVGVDDGGSGLMASVLPTGTRRTDGIDTVFANL